MGARRASRGFTLTELMVTVAVAAVLVMIAVPSFRNLIQRQRVAGSFNALVSSLQYARTEAINRSIYVAVCPAVVGATTTAGNVSCAGTSTYETGWLVYSYPVSLGANVAFDSTKGAQVLRINAAQSGVSIRAKDTTVVTFGQQGQVQPLSATAVHNVQFAVCASNSSGSLGQNTSSVPGALLVLSGSGGIANQQLASGAACTP